MESVIENNILREIVKTLLLMSFSNDVQYNIQILDTQAQRKRQHKEP